jgi:hypothetical protein
MRRKWATISSQDDPEPAFAATGVLQERNSNVYDTIFTKLPNRRAFLSKKTVSLKFQQAHKDHCCIDIVSRKNFSSTQQRRVSNIQFLKQQINYLERDQLKWDMFPKDNQENEPIPSTAPSDSDSRGEFEVHSLNRLEIGEQAQALRAFRNTFKSNLYSGNNGRPLTTEEKPAGQHGKGSMRKCSALLPDSVSERAIAIHSNISLSSPFRKYFQDNRTRRNRSCSVQVPGVEGRGLAARAAFVIEDLPDD